jgi:chemotaxis protein CheD
VKIGPGEYHATAQELMIVTVLGSCISVCLRDPEKRAGGMNHFMLPHHGGGSHALLSDSARYGAYAMEILINQLLRLGCDRERLEAKVFGGGKILGNMIDVGRMNADFALNYLQTEKIRLLATDVGESCARKVYFDPLSGRVFVRQFKGSGDASVVRSETAYGKRLDKMPVSGEVELF